MIKKNLVEVFTGSRSVGIEAEKQGMKVFSIDWTAYDNIDLVFGKYNVTNSNMNSIVY